MLTVPVAPFRSSDQRLDALAHANIVRVARARIKQEIRVGATQVATLIAEPPALLRTMKVYDLLVAVPKMGPTKATKLMRSARISEAKTVSGMSDRQRTELLTFLVPAAA